jgi:VCBS repeat-containing protein
VEPRAAERAGEKAVRAALVSGPTKGTLTPNANGSFTYGPRANLNGTDTFTYRASDDHGGTDTATVTIRIAAVNDAPVITPISPAPGASITDRTPLIRARDVETDLAKASIKLFVDGLEVPASGFVYDPSTDVLSRTPTTALGFGNHTVKVVATDAQDKGTTRQWGFKVVQGGS